MEGIKIKKVYALKTRNNDSESWSEPEYFERKIERDKAASTMRILLGMRTYSYVYKVKSKPLDSENGN